MMAFIIKENDLLPTLDATLSDAGGVFDLTAATGVTFIMNATKGGTPKISAAATVTNALNGMVRYEWTGTDTDEVGTYMCEFEVTIGGKTITFPNDSYFQVEVKADLNSELDE